MKKNLVFIFLLISLSACSKKTTEINPATINAPPAMEEQKSVPSGRSFTGFVFGDSKENCLKLLDASKIKLYRSKKEGKSESLYFNGNGQLNGVKNTVLRFWNNKLVNVYLYFTLSLEDKESSEELYSTLKIKIAEKFGELKKWRKGDSIDDWYYGEKTEKEGIEVVIEKTDEKLNISIFIACTDMHIIKEEQKENASNKTPKGIGSL